MQAQEGEGEGEKRKREKGSIYQNIPLLSAMFVHIHIPPNNP